MFFIEKFKKDFPEEKYNDYVYNHQINSIYKLIGISSEDEDPDVLLWCYKNYKTLFKQIIFNHSRWWLNLEVFPLKYFDEFLKTPTGLIIEEYVKKCLLGKEIKRLQKISKTQKKLFFEYLLDEKFTFKKAYNYIGFIKFCYEKNREELAKKYFPKLFEQQDFTKYLDKITSFKGYFFNYQAPILNFARDFNLDKSIINTEIGNILDNCMCSSNYDYVNYCLKTIRILYYHKLPKMI